MKILWAHSHFDSGGGPKTVLAWALGLRDLGHEIHFIGHGGRLLDTVINNGFDFFPLVGDRFRPSLAYVFQFYQYAKKIDPDVLISVGTVTSMELALAAYLLKKPILLIFNVTRNTFWLEDDKWYFPQIADTVVINQQFKELCVKKYEWDENRIHYVPERLIINSSNNLPAIYSSHRLCIVRRLDHIKAKSVVRLLEGLEEYLDLNKEITVDIIGDGSQHEAVAAISDVINRRLARQAISCIGYVDGIENKLDDYDLVIGTEKVAIESIVACKPTAILMDNGGLILVTMKNIADLSRDNFIGNFCVDTSDNSLSDVLKDLSELNFLELTQLAEWVKLHYDHQIGAQKISVLLETASAPKFFLTEYLPQLLKMYFSIFLKGFRNTRRT